jgi:hypothetical protein
VGVFTQFDPWWAVERVEANPARSVPGGELLPRLNETSAPARTPSADVRTSALAEAAKTVSFGWLASDA